jgi:hypothetical protein
MSIASTALSKDEKSPPLLVSRKEAARLLGGTSTSTIRRFEKLGLLKGIRLNRRVANGQVFFRYTDLLKLIKESVTD